MCRNIKSLYNFDPPATKDEIQAAALQFVRKVSGFHEPSKVNEVAFNHGIAEIAQTTKRLLDSLVTQAPTRNRESEIEKSRIRSIQRFDIKT
jgi:hypothetical protein